MKHKDFEEQSYDYTNNKDDELIDNSSYQNILINDDQEFDAQKELKKYEDLSSLHDKENDFVIELGEDHLDDVFFDIPPDFEAENNVGNLKDEY